MLTEQDRTVVWINLDETCVPWNFGALRGTRARGCKAKPENMSLGERRGHVTVVALVSNDEAVQRVLPQLIIGNSRKLNNRDIAQMRPLLPSWLHLLTAPSAWVNEEHMLMILEVLGQALQPVAHGRRFVLVMDSFRAHFTPAVGLLARALGILLLIVPAGMTGELQPLDTHVFKGFKMRMRNGCLRWRCADAAGRLTPGAWFLEMVRSLIVLRDTSWTIAFQQCGIDAGQTMVSRRKQQLLADHPLPWGPVQRPSRADVACILNTRSPLSWYNDLVPARRPRVIVLLAPPPSL